MTSLEIASLAAAAALLKGFLTVLVQGAIRFRFRRFAQPEDAYWLGGDPKAGDHPLAATAQLALRNDAENIPTFLFLLFGYALLGGSPTRVALHAVAFFVARSLHTVAYLRRRQPARNVFFQIGLLSTISLCGHVLWEVRSL